MARRRLENLDWKNILLACIYSPLMILLLILFLFYYYNYLGLDFLAYIGWFFWVLSIVFGILPIYEFRKKGQVRKGRSYIHTTRFVDTGIYSIVRHPQYLAGLLLVVALVLLTQHWLSAVAGSVAFIAFYVDTFRADPPLIEKFGTEYEEYMKRVPRLNFLMGIARRMRGRTLR